ncbi:Sister chromatid cohesion protein DCC1 [Microtus ochrogaster]|uniref:Sister chromatid cohesion protein DCC1 n=1 Tax=Microtus ochrogaster TaxID=79684 RepID=A0A8J6H294_MICOH|nr:Sister chromatid cohesion protein DCC1 [Microtus ochrogaster]
MSFCPPLPPRSCSFVIRGDKDEQAVLCSQDKTYDLKIADTSNMLLVIPGCKTPEQLKGEEAQSNIVHSEGLALVDRNSRPEIIFLLKVDDLPEGTQERFNSLFSLREKWMEEDIAPYIQFNIIGDAERNSCVIVSKGNLVSENCNSDNKWICQKDPKCL